ncbi:MAG TPA: LLM class flavin-dependent oxidoreductase [Gaiellaceae bacterium]|nr:LLM class flavin-dependent oxidoreductase [Gaiellaceae bacterium]
MRGRRSAAPGWFTLPLVRVALMVEGQEGVSWDQWLALAEGCEEHGIVTLFRSDHYLSLTAPRERPATDAWTLLGALAGRTSKLRLGTLVSPVTFRHPAVAAKAAATVDHISGGRVEVGLGAGWMQLEHETFGFPFPETSERVRMLAEQLERVDGLLRDDPVTVQQPRPPLIVGGAARRGTAEPAARFADEYNTFGVDAPEAERRRKRLDEACERIGRDPATLHFSLMTPFLLDRDHARRFVERYPNAGTADQWFDELDRRGLAGDLVAGLREYEAVGVERVMLQHVVHEDLDVVAAIGREIAPVLGN